MNIGNSIEELQQLVNTPLVPSPSWIRNWQTDAEHIIFQAHSAKDTNNLEELKNLDIEARNLIKLRQEKLS